jgi:hypothetical protein
MHGWIFLTDSLGEESSINKSPIGVGIDISIGVGFLKADPDTDPEQRPISLWKDKKDE